MRLILHVGTHKTGTTSIQTLLHTQRDWYRERGVVIPGSDERFRKSETPHHSFAHGLTGTDSAALDASLSYANDFRRDALSISSGQVLISAEPLYRHITGSMDFGALAADDYWEKRESYLRTVARVLEDFDTEVVIALRRQDEFAESLHLSLRERRAGFPTFDQFLSVMAGRMGEYRRQIELLRSVFGKVRVLSYHRLARSGDLVSSFLRELNLPVPEQTAPVWVRRTPDARLLLWAEDMQGHKNPLRQFINSQAARKVIGVSRARLWDTAKRDVFLAQFAEQNSALERQFADPAGVPFFSELQPVTGEECVLTRTDSERLAAAYEAWLDRRRRSSHTHHS